MRKVGFKVILLLLCFTFLAFPVCAYGNGLSDSVNAVFLRLEGVTETNKSQTEEKPIEKIEEEENVEPAKEPDIEDTNKRPSKNKGSTTKNTDTIIIKPIPDFKSDSIMQRVQEGGSIPVGEMTDSVDSLGTGFYNIVAHSVIGFAPIVLIIGAFIMLFTKGRKVGFLLLSVVAIFVILNAPEIIAVLINFIANVFR